MENNSFFGLYKEIIDRDGKKHKIYSCKIKDLNKLVDFTTKYNPVYLQIQALELWVDENGEPKLDENKHPMYMYQNPSFINGIYEIIEMALDYKETREEINTWLDFNLITLIIQEFLGLSQFKKTDVDNNKNGSWNKLFASIVSNTSLTISDIKEMTVAEFEELLDGMNEYSKEIEEEIKNGNKEVNSYEGESAIEKLQTLFG